MHRVVASWFGTGLILRVVRGSDVGSGTVGSVFALGLSLWLSEFGWIAQLSALLVVGAASIWSARPFAHAKEPDPMAKEGDPGWVVVDEAAGTLLATIGLGAGPAIVAWVVFRAADIYKRCFPGVAAAERLPGSVGITADDLVAGAYGLFVGSLLQAFLG